MYQLVTIIFYFSFLLWLYNRVWFILLLTQTGFSEEYVIDAQRSTWILFNIISQ